MKRSIRKKASSVRRFVFAVGCMLLLAECAFPQCDPDSNGYAYLHPAFANRNWGKAAFDSLAVDISPALCALKPAQYDIAGPAASATAMFTTAANDLYMVQTQYECPSLKPPCTFCYLDYLDPVNVSLTGITLAQGTPVYLVKGPAYGVDSVKLLVKNAQKNILSVSLSTKTLATLHVDTLKPAALLAGQEVFAICGAHDSTALRDTAVWLLGSNGLVRYFAIAAGTWTETSFDLGAGVADTVLCAQDGFAGTSTGSIYKHTGSKFLLDNQPVTHGLTFVSSKGAAGRQGTFVDRVGNSWVSRPIGAADYRTANFIDRWDGRGVELLDAQWRRTAATYRLSSSRIDSAAPAALRDSVNRMPFAFDGTAPASFFVQLGDTDQSFTDVSFMLSSQGAKVNMKSDGIYTIGSIPPDSQCVIDSLRLKTGNLSIIATPLSIQISAQCELGERDLSCPVFKCMRVDYPFVSNHAWSLHDTLAITAGSDKVRIAYDSSASVTALSGLVPHGSAASVTHKQAGNTLVFSIKQGTARRLTRIALYNVSGKSLAVLDIGNRRSIAVPDIGSAGVVYAKYFLSDGTTSNTSILLLR